MAYGTPLTLYNESVFMNLHSRVLPGMLWKPLVKSLLGMLTHLKNLSLQLAPQGADLANMSIGSPPSLVTHAQAGSGSLAAAIFVKQVFG